MKWKEENNNSNILEEDLSDFMKEIYQIAEEGINILDILNTMRWLLLVIGGGRGRMFLITAQ